MNINNKATVVLFMLVSSLFFNSCKNEPGIQFIQGEIRADKDFTDEVIYLRPMNDSAVEPDSAIVKDGKFFFQVSADTVALAVLRPKNGMLAYFLQPLLVVVEPGELHVQMAGSSSASGTLLNETLQKWKDRKMASDEELAQIQQRIRQAEDADITALKEEKERLVEAFKAFNFSFVQANKDNVVGQFVFSQCKGQLSPEQIKQLGME